MDTGYAQKKRCRARNRGSVWREEKEVLGWKGFVKQVGFEPGVKKRTRTPEKTVGFCDTVLIQCSESRTASVEYVYVTGMSAVNVSRFNVFWY